MLEHRYTDLQPLRTTAVGDISSAIHRVLGRPVHVCVIADELREETRAALDARVKRVSTLTHPHILAIVDAEFETTPAFFVTESVQAEALLALLHEQEFTPSRALRIISELLSAVHCAHSHDVVHGGLSPARVFFDAVGSVRLGEFGFGSARTDARAGTVAIDTDAMPYLPIRVLRNPEAYDAAADLHCAAAIGFHLLTGTAPENGPPNEVEGVSQALVAALSALMQDGAGLSELTEAVALFGGQAHISEDDVVQAVATGTEGADSESYSGSATESGSSSTEDGNEDETTEESAEAVREDVDAKDSTGVAEVAERDAETAQHPTSREAAVRAATAEAPIVDTPFADDSESTSAQGDDDEQRSTSRGLSPARASGATVAMASPGAANDDEGRGSAATPSTSTSAMDTIAGIPVGGGATLLDPSAALLEQVASLSGSAPPRDDVSSLDVTDEDVQSSGPHVAAEDDSAGVATFGEASADSQVDPGVSAAPPGPPPAASAAPENPAAAAKEAADRVAGKLNKYAHLLGQ